MEKDRCLLPQPANIIFFIDQMNPLDILDNDDEKMREEKWTLRSWLTRFRTGHKAILSTSANYRAYIQQSEQETTEATMRVYGGLTPVSLNRTAASDFLTMI